MENEKKKDGYKKKSQGSYAVDGRRIIFEKGQIKKNGKKMLLEMFAIECQPKTSIFITGVYSVEHSEIFEEKIKRSVDTAKLSK